MWVIPAEVEGRARPLLNEPFDERDARMSPVGQWVAYVSNESGRAEVSARSMSGPVRRVTISATGGAQPVWRRDGLELFFVDPGGALRSVPVQWSASGTPTFGWRIWNEAPRFGSQQPPFPTFRPSGLPIASVWPMSPETYLAGLARES